ncbi:transposase domain-containing protein [Arhodomonas sp. AD133]|uniref:transposase domain-containing protein n=1 Tax=Arhodomonas sp. AD133 TaxID=3415009 RepID=UPI003EBC3B51
MHTASTSAPSYEQLLAENAKLRRQLDWLKRQLFGQKSERRRVDGDSAVADLFARDQAPEPEARPRQRIRYERDQRGSGKDRGDAVTEEGLRFDADVPVETIDLGAPELTGADADAWEIIDYRITHRL